MIRSTRIGLLASGGLAALLLALAAPAMGALPRSYDVQRIDSPSPRMGANFGIGLIGHSDLNGDEEDDVLVPQTATGPNNDGQIFVFSGATGALIDTINAPDAGNPTDATSGNNRANFGLFTSTLADLGSCPGGSAGADCAAPSATADGVDEIVTGATGIDIPTAGAPNGLAVDIGRAYVFDGRTRALLKRIDMPVADRVEHATFPAGPPNPHSPSFGRTVLAPAGQTPCEGRGGIGQCPPIPETARIGDVDGAFDADTNDLADLVIGAPTYDETPASNPACGFGQCHEAGRSYIYRGEDIIDPGTGGAAVPLAVPLRTLKNLTAQTDDPVSSAQTNSELFGQAVFPIGDVGRCNGTIAPGALCTNTSSTNIPDGSPEVVISSFRTDLPSFSDAPDPAFFDVGVNMLVDGRTGSVLSVYQHPEPQAGAIFGFTLHNEPAPGDLGSTNLPDVLIPAMRQNHDFTAQGRAYVMNGNFKAGANGINFAQLNDPTPQSGGNFGVSSAGVGDLVSDAEGAPRNELLIGSFGPHNPGTNADVINDVSIFNPVTERRLQTIPDPDQQKGSSFGTALAPLGDVNDDGFLDYTISADLWDANASTGRNQGRVYILRSNNSRPPAGGAAPGPGATAPRNDPAPFSGCLAATANLIRGTSAANTLTGTPAGDRIFAGTGNDIVDALAGNDCVDLGTGTDRGQGGSGDDILAGGLGEDRIAGSSGDDRIRGNPDADRLEGGTGNDSIFGDEGNDALLGSFGNDRLHGVSGNDRVSGSRGRDSINGGSGRDTISAGSSGDQVAGDQGGDRINGNSGNDTIRGNSGNDRLTGSTGADRLSGGSGNDRISARDGRRDRVACGRGRDTVTADRSDRVSRDCERVLRTG